MRYIAVLFVSACLTCYHNSAKASENLETQKAKEFGAEVRDILVNRIVRQFTALNTLEQKYADLHLKSVPLNSTQIVDEKVAALKKILQSREDLVQRIATEAEKLWRVDAPETITNDDITFYKEEGEDSESSTNSSETAGLPTEAPKKLFYRNTKCECGYQLPEDVPDSTCVRSRTGYAQSQQFGRLGVSFEMSAVHIPTEIYNQGPEVLRDVYLSQGMNEILKEAVCDSNSTDSHLTRWVYYATQRGVMRFFPDRVWDDECEKPDVFDGRVTPWFVQSASSPKDVTILIDNSGSVQGLTLNLFYRSVRHFLDTLGTNDFVNIVLFNEEAKFINERCTGLLQATPRNKQILQKWMENIHVGNLSSFENGFDLALRTLNGTSQSESPHANCNPMIMLFTDGGETYPNKALTKWNPNGEKRVFTFAAGKNFYEKSSTRDIACKNRGSFHLIPSYTATKSEVQSYLAKISEPTASKEKYIKWTLPYLDHLGLGLVVSASTPVYEQDDENGIAKLLGVVGTDLLLKDLKKVVTDPEMSLEYYPFAIDNNGFAMFHPSMVENMHSDIVTVDLMDLEHSNIAEIRRNMIDGKTGTSLLTKEFVFDGRYQATSEYTYTYAPVGGTLLKFGLAVHSSRLRYYDAAHALASYFPDMTLKKLVDQQYPSCIALLYSSPCEDEQQTNFNPCNTTQTANISEGLSYEEGISLDKFADISCRRSAQLYPGLLIHALLSNDICGNKWSNNSTIEDGDGVLAVYTALETPSFLQFKLLNFSAQTSGKLENSDEQIRKEITSVLSNPRNKTYLRRAVHRLDLTIYSYIGAPTLPEAYPTESTSNSTNFATTTEFSTTAQPTTATTSGPYTKNARRGYILASKAVKTSVESADTTSSASPFTTVVTGVVFDPDVFRENLFSLAYKCNASTNCSTGTEELLCSDSERTACLILDDGGYLISSNQEEHYDKIDKFFGLVDGEFMRSLVNKKVYNMKYVYDYQAMCENSASDRSAAMPRYFVPTIADIISFGWWLSSSAQIFFYTFFQTCLITLWSLFDVGMSHIHVSPGTEMPTTREHCIVRSTILNFGPNSQMLYGTFGCTEICDRSFTSVHLKDTNLLLIVAETDAACREDCSKITVFSNEAVDVTLDETCGNKTIRYRKRPDEQCYDASTMPKELDSACSNSWILLPSMRTISFFIFMHFFIHQFL